MIAEARATVLDQLVDPIDDVKETPTVDEELTAINQNRSALEGGEGLIVVRACTTYLGGLPVGQDGPSVGEFGEWFCACH